MSGKRIRHRHDHDAGGDQPIRIAYTGATWKGKEVFDSTWDAEPASVTLDDIIADFATALKGATVGSQLLVVAPSSDGDATIYVVDLLGIDDPAATR